ncbi:MAG: sialate O-acetylesterase [Paludibacter sp.]
MKKFYFIILFFCCYLHSTAVLTLPRFFSNNMVLQQNTQTNFWGKADAGKTISITASWGQSTSVVTNASGVWTTKIQTPVAIPGQAPTYSITITDGTTTINLNNVLVGEVWVSNGQSNMWLHAGYQPTVFAVYHKAELDAANFPNIRFLTINPPVSLQTKTATLPVVDSTWMVCSPTSAYNFAFIPFYFARALYSHPALNVPIGMINTSWAGRPISDFMSATALASSTSVINYNAGSPQSSVYLPMIKQIIPYSIKGMIWYQGEYNVNSPTAGYTDSQAAMIADYRASWGTNFSFYTVQLAPYFDPTTHPSNRDLSYGIPLFREVQNAIVNTPKTGIVVNADLCPDSANLRQIHPLNKRPVGERLAALALVKDYGINMVCEGPTYLSHKIQGSTIVVSYKPSTLGTGLMTKDGKSVSNFRIAGSDNKFYPALAIISANTVIVSSPNVPNPVNVRYAFSDGAMTNLQNIEGFPAFPFRTDNLSGLNGATYIDLAYPSITANANVLEPKISCSPNPVQDILNINFSENDIYMVELLDINGRILISKKMNHSGPISLSAFSTNIYFCRLKSTAGFNKMVKIIKC